MPRVGTLDLMRATRFGADLAGFHAPPRAGDDLLIQLDTMAPWLAAHLRALADGDPRPSVEVPQPFLELVNGAWEAAS